MKKEKVYECDSCQMQVEQKEVYMDACPHCGEDALILIKRKERGAVR